MLQLNPRVNPTIFFWTGKSSCQTPRTFNLCKEPALFSDTLPATNFWLVAPISNKHAEKYWHWLSQGLNCGAVGNRFKGYSLKFGPEIIVERKSTFDNVFTRVLLACWPDWMNIWIYISFILGEAIIICILNYESRKKKQIKKVSRKKNKEWMKWMMKVTKLKRVIGNEKPRIGKNK